MCIHIHIGFSAEEMMDVHSVSMLTNEEIDGLLLRDEDLTVRTHTCSINIQIHTMHTHIDYINPLVSFFPPIFPPIFLLCFLSRYVPKA